MAAQSCHGPLGHAAADVLADGLICDILEQWIFSCGDVVEAEEPAGLLQQGEGGAEDVEEVAALEELLHCDIVQVDAVLQELLFLSFVVYHLLLLSRLDLGKPDGLHPFHAAPSLSLLGQLGLPLALLRHLSPLSGLVLP